MDTDLSTRRCTINSPASSPLSRQCSPLMDTAMLAAAIVLLASIKCSARKQECTQRRKTLERARRPKEMRGWGWWLLSQRRRRRRNCAKQFLLALTNNKNNNNTGPDWNATRRDSKADRGMGRKRRRRELGRARNYKRHIIIKRIKGKRIHWPISFISSRPPVLPPPPSHSSRAKRRDEGWKLDRYPRPVRHSMSTWYIR